MILINLFVEFFKTGLFAFGGGLATVPFLMEMPAKYGWFTSAELADIIAVSESTPGPIGINMATYAGFKAGGIVGALVATTALMLPSIIVILLIAKYLHNFSEKKAVRDAFYGLRPVVCALIAAAAYRLFVDYVIFTGSGLNYLALLFFIIFIILMRIRFTKNIHPIVWIIMSALVGICFKI